jgi:uncharacterized protein (UPF0276 family)
MKVARLNKALESTAPMVGDVLRAVTCTNFVYRTQALFGAVAPQRTIVLYGADNQKWSQASPHSPVTLHGMGRLCPSAQALGTVRTAREHQVEGFLC